MTASVAGRTAKALVTVGAAAAAILLLVPLGRAWKLAADLGHGWAAPLLIGYLLWERWPHRPAARPHPVSAAWWAALIAAAAAALPLRLLLTPYPLWPALKWAYTALLIAVALAGAWLLAGRPGVRWLGGPLILLAAALPWESELESHFIYPLREGMAGLTAEVSNLLGHPAIAAGTSVRLGHGWVGVDEACGGIRSLEASIMLALFFGEWLRFRWPRRLALVAAGILAALLGNFLRILFLSLRAAAGTAAFFAAHDAAGWLALSFSLALTGLLAWRWARADRTSTKDGPATRIIRPSGPPSPATACWILAAAALLACDEGVARAWYARGTAAAAAIPQWTARLPKDLPAFRPATLTEEDRAMLVPDSYFAGSWPAGDENLASAYYIEWQGGQVARFVPFLHNPTVCLPLAGCELQATLDDIAVPSPAGELSFHNYIFRRAGEDLAVAFIVWDPSRDRPLTPAAESALDRFGWLRQRWQEVREGRADQPAQLLSVAVSGAEAETKLRVILTQLVVGP